LSLNTVLDRNIAALLARKRAEEFARTRSEKLADAVTHFAGSMAFVYIHAVVFGLWIVINLGWLGLPRFDPSFVILAMVASVEAIFLSTFVLITQNRLSQEESRRSDLDLQISLLAEHEVTRLIALTDAIAEKLGVVPPNEGELEELKQDVQPEQVLDRIQARKAG
jgi:uncharacterized membrane protein